MRLSTYIQRTRALGDLKVPETSVEQIAEMIGTGASSFDDVLALRNDRLSPRMLLGLWRAGQRHRIHQNYLQFVAERRRNENQPPIPWALLKHTISRHEVAVLERAEALAPVGRSAEHRRRDAIKTAVELWNSCLAITRKEAQLNIVLDTDVADLVHEFGSFTETATIQTISPHRWLGIRRGERLGALRLSFTLPMDRLRAQVEARSSSLSALSAGREDDTILEALVLTDLEEWVLARKDDEAEFLAMRNAGNAYLNLLSTDAPDHRVYAAINVPPKGPLGLAIFLRDGRLVGHDSLEVNGSPVTALERAIGKHPVEAVILPSDSRQSELLESIKRGFSSLKVIQTTAKGLAIAIRSVTNDVPTVVKGAIALGRRTIAPRDHWLSLDPVALGIAEYQQELDGDALRTFYADMQALARVGVTPEQLTGKPPKAQVRSAARQNPKALNPMVKSTDDLRAGMQVSGVVTNITQFGAFVNLGLPHEGLVHVSELADHFVSDPNEVVVIGQQVKASVLGIDRARQRISLSMRSDASTGSRRQESPALSDRIDGPSRNKGTPLDDIPGQGRRPAARDSLNRGRPSANVSRSQALADLEALFRKK